MKTLLFILLPLNFRSMKAQTNTVDSTAHKKKLVEVNMIVSKIKISTTRQEIEKIFLKQDSGLKSLSNVRYYEDPEVMIEIPYDDNKGVGSGYNKVYKEKRPAKGKTLVFRSKCLCETVTLEPLKFIKVYFIGVKIH